MKQEYTSTTTQALTQSIEQGGHLNTLIKRCGWVLKWVQRERGWDDRVVHTAIRHDYTVGQREVSSGGQLIRADITGVGKLRHVVRDPSRCEQVNLEQRVAQ